MELLNDHTLINLKKYLDGCDEVSFSFLFGSRSKGLNRMTSDYDIGIYFKPRDSRIIETEEIEEYPQVNNIWADLELMLKKEVDLIILNNAPSHLASTIITQGTPVIIKDEMLFSKFFLITTSNAIDYRAFVRDYYEIYNRSSSLSETDKTNLKKILIFIEKEIKDYNLFRNFSWLDYESDRNKRRNLERWIENLINSVIDISKILISSEKVALPETYRELILKLKLIEIMENDSLDKLASWTKLRNILAHEYLDIKWTSIKKFITESEEILTTFFYRVKEKIGNGEVSDK